MGDPKPPLPDEFNDPQIDRLLGKAEEYALNDEIERAVTGDNESEYREPADPKSHDAMRDAMLEQYYYLNNPELRGKRPPGENFETAEDLEGLLQQLKIVVDEWHRKPGSSARREGVRILELPIIQSLSMQEIPLKDYERVIDLLSEFITFGDGDKAREEAMILRDRLLGQ